MAWYHYMFHLFLKGHAMMLASCIAIAFSTFSQAVSTYSLLVQHGTQISLRPVDFTNAPRKKRYALVDRHVNSPSPIPLPQIWTCGWSVEEGSDSILPSSGSVRWPESVEPHVGSTTVGPDGNGSGATFQISLIPVEEGVANVIAPLRGKTFLPRFYGRRIFLWPFVEEAWPFCRGSLRTFRNPLR